MHKHHDKHLNTATGGIGDEQLDREPITSTTSRTATTAHCCPTVALSTFSWFSRCTSVFDVSTVHWLSGEKPALLDHKDLFLPGKEFHLITNAAERIQQQANAEISKQMMCNLCGKLNDESHMRSKIHLQKVAEQAHLDIALGRLIPFALR